MTILADGRQAVPSKTLSLKGLPWRGGSRLWLFVLALAVAILSVGCARDSSPTEVGLAEAAEEADAPADSGTSDSASSGDLDAGAYGPTEPTATSGTLSALTYNVAGLPDLLSGSNPEVNTALIAPRLNDFELVLLQESWRTPNPNPQAPLRTYHEDLEAASTLPFRSIPLAPPLGGDAERPEALLSDGLNRFSTLSFDNVIRQRWSGCGDAAADCLALKGFSMARTTLAPGVEVDVYNLHMEAGREDAPLRGENVAELTAFINANSVGNAIIVGGDFNLHLDRDPDADQFGALLAGTGLTDVCSELGCDQPTRIDKFLYRSSTAITITPTTWQNRTDDFMRDDATPLSDHDPVAVTFDWTVD